MDAFCFNKNGSYFIILLISQPQPMLRAQRQKNLQDWETRNFALPLVDVEDVLFVCLLDRIHNQVACLSESAEDESLR